jgi:hypothetical protein
VLLLGGLAGALGVTTDELLGLKPTKVQDALKKRRLWKRLQRIESLPERSTIRKSAIKPFHFAVMSTVARVVAQSRRSLQPLPDLS